MADNIERACGFAGPRFPRARRIVCTHPHALSILSAILNMTRSGDAVYSQEELDQVIAQLPQCQRERHP
jgi:hypothetical protein